MTTAPLLVCLHLYHFVACHLFALYQWKVPGTRGLFLLDNINWAPLTNLHLKCKLSVENCLFVLHHSTLLRYYHLEMIRVDEVVSSDHLSITPLTHLQSLQIEANIIFIPILQPLTLPALALLTISATAPQARFTRSISLS